MSEQRLNHANVRAALEQMGRKAMAKRMQLDRLAQPRGFGGLFEQPAELTRGQWLMITAAWKQPALFGREVGVIRRRSRLPQLPQQLQAGALSPYTPGGSQIATPAPSGERWAAPTSNELAPSAR